jgi:hypothetical protein
MPDKLDFKGLDIGSPLDAETGDGFPERDGITAAELADRI